VGAVEAQTVAAIFAFDTARHMVLHHDLPMTLLTQNYEIG
jgi:hypothetical protein